MTNRFELPRTPEDFFPIMEARFNSLDVEAALELFHQDSIMIDVAGDIHRGVAEIGSELKRYFSLGLPMDLTQRHLFVTGDTALSICDWSYDGVAKNGATIKMNGSTSDVIRRCDDGIWRYAIDNPFGTQSRAAKVMKNTAN
jgi:ketosteroid isomerase-like protein